MFVVLSFEKLCVRMNMVVSEVLNATLFPALSWTEQLAKCQFHFAGKVARAILVNLGHQLLARYWNFAFWITNLPAECWVSKALAWKQLPTYPVRGRLTDPRAYSSHAKYHAIALTNSCQWST